MRTSIKQKAIHCLAHGFYPEHVVNDFLSCPQHKKSANWVNSLDNPQVLTRYVYCRDVKFFGYAEKVERCKRAYYRSCDVTTKKLEDFLHLNNLLLVDVYEKTTHEDLKRYYKAIACLNGVEPRASSFLYERRKMEEIVHKLQAKLINAFIQAPLSKQELRSFVMIAVLFSEGDLLHDEDTRDNFLKLCAMC